MEYRQDEDWSIKNSQGDDLIKSEDFSIHLEREYQAKRTKGFFFRPLKEWGINFLDRYTNVEEKIKLAIRNNLIFRFN